MEVRRTSIGSTLNEPTPNITARIVNALNRGNFDVLTRALYDLKEKVGQEILREQPVGTAKDTMSLGDIKDRMIREIKKSPLERTFTLARLAFLIDELDQRFTDEPKVGHPEAVFGLPGSSLIHPGIRPDIKHIDIAASVPRSKLSFELSGMPNWIEQNRLLDVINLFVYKPDIETRSIQYEKLVQYLLIQRDSLGGRLLYLGGGGDIRTPLLATGCTTLDYVSCQLIGDVADMKLTQDDIKSLKDNLQTIINTSTHHIFEEQDDASKIVRILIRNKETGECDFKINYFPMTYQDFLAGREISGSQNIYNCIMDKDSWLHAWTDPKKIQGNIYALLENDGIWMGGHQLMPNEETCLFRAEKTDLRWSGYQTLVIRRKDIVSDLGIDFHSPTLIDTAISSAMRGISEELTTGTEAQYNQLFRKEGQIDALKYAYSGVWEESPITTIATYIHRLLTRPDFSKTIDEIKQDIFMLKPED